MKEFFKNIKNDRLTSRGYYLTFFLNILTIIYALFYLNSLPPFIPLFNQLPWGEKRLITSIGIFLPIFVAIAISLFNLFFSTFIYKKNPLIPRIFTLTSLLISILTLLFVIRTIQIVL